MAHQQTPEPNQTDDALRRNITVMFTDLVDFTPLAERIGEESVFNLVRQITREQTAAIEAEGGTLQDFAGDGIMAVFGAPTALEDAALRACRAALDIQLRIERKQREFEAEWGIIPYLRIGLHTGTAVIGRIGEDRALAQSALGDSVNVAARIQAAADPGSIFLSNATLKLVDGFVDVEDKGNHLLKGKSEPFALFSLKGLRKHVTRFGASTQRGLSTFVGRSTDLDRLTDTWQRAKAGGFRVVNIVGDAGIGKSRLIHEFQQRIIKAVGGRHEAGCQPENTGTPFHPIIELIRRDFGIPAPCSTAQATRILTDNLMRLDIDPDPVLTYLVHLFCGSGEKSDLGTIPSSELVGVRTRRALTHILSNLAKVQSSLLLVIEDLHWADGATQDVLKQLISADLETSGLVLCTFRPQFVPPWAGDTVSELRLAPLTTRDLTSLVEERVRATANDGVEIGDAIARADGNPLFAEELAGYLQGDSSTGELPARLENLIMGRVQCLGSEALLLMQSASVIGRTFPSDLAANISGLNDRTTGVLNLLDAEDLVHPVQDQAGTPGIYAFKHALVRDALYGSLLSAQRSHWHLAAADELETSSKGELTEPASVLAMHFELGGNTAKAVRYLDIAADRSLRLFSLKEALSALDHALEIVRSQPDCVDDEAVAGLVLNRLMIACWEADFNGMIAIAEEFLPRIERVGSSRALSRTLAWLGEGYLNAERLAEAEATLNRAHAIGVEISCRESTAYATWDLAWLQSISPDNRSPDLYAERLNEVLHAAEQLKDVYLETLVYFLFCNDALERGHVVQAKPWLEKLFSLGKTTGYPPAKSVALFCSSLLASMSDEPEKALADAEQCVSGAAGLTESQSGQCALGIALLACGRAGESADTLDRLTNDVEESGFLAMMSGSELPRCVAHAIAGDPLRAIAGLENAILRFGRRGNARLVATAHLMLGEIYMAVSAAPRPPVLTLARNPRLVLLGLAASRRSRSHFEEAAILARQSGNQGTLIRALIGLATIAAGPQEQPARRQLHEARQISETVGARNLTIKIDQSLDRFAD